MNEDVCIDLYCGLGGWTEGFLAENFTVIGFDIERHDYGTGGYPGQLVLQDVLTIHGAQFKPILDRLRVIVASPPCQKYSYMAMPWKRAKALAAWYREDASRQIELNALFNACFRIQREASEAAGRRIPLIVENVKGATPWVGQAQWHFGSYYLWGDIPALMPITCSRKSEHSPLCEVPAGTGKTSWFFGNSKHEGRFYGKKNEGGSWFNVAHNTTSGVGQNPDGRKAPGQDWSRFAKTGEVSPHWRMEGQKTVGHLNVRDGHSRTRHLTNQAEHVKGFNGIASGRGNLGKNTLGRMGWSNSEARARASAEIAKIPFPLAQHIARCFASSPILSSV